jgi:hypothetical protein
MADLLAFLTAIRPTPRAFPGNAPAIVKAEDGRLILPATHAELYGERVEFESDFKNVGMWHGANDRAEWRIRLPKAGTFDVYLDFACDPGSAGNELVIEGGDPALRWKVAATSGWPDYRATKVGTLKLPSGDGRLVVRPAGPLRGALIDLRTVYLVPPGESPPSVKDPRKK